MKTRDLLIHDYQFEQQLPTNDFEWKSLENEIKTLRFNNGLGGHGPKAVKVILKTGEESVFVGHNN